MATFDLILIVYGIATILIMTFIASKGDKRK